MRGTWKTLILGLALALGVGVARGEQPRWGAPASQFATEPSAPGNAGVRIGRPMPLNEPEQPASAAVVPSSSAPESSGPGVRFVRGQSPDFARTDVPVPAAPLAPGVPPPPPPPPPPAAAGPPPESYLCGQVTNTTKSGGFFEGVRELPGKAATGVGGFFTPAQGHSLFESDTCFPWMISPVSNPFFAEDPRALTELRPIFLFQTIPHRNDVAAGGNVGWFGLQGRLAVTDRLSLVVNKLGLVWIDPRDHVDGIGRQVGFSELWLGPKFTFIRNDETKTLLAGGLTFQIPTGPAHVFQNTGSLSMAPYLSFAQNFLKTDLGSFNFMNTTGYAFAVDNHRSDYVYTQFHLDFDVGNCNKWFPLIEFNWTHYTQNGNAHNFDFEGNDLFNFGAHAAGTNYFSLAFGLRYKFCEGIQIGTAFQFPVDNPHNLESFRWTIDMIFRY
jgi:hypothetical protein